eukprot:TRINITY_DN6531_c0_g1_i7.p1 TRINITY_DN6531_c0_g1~~TRINITY_DN6531_c0_g1_i7.p1  ORF type:complete len:145 (-),score=51.17 TRINITY_DN6531_c0_g1_i7:74-508(-)
MCIRDRFVVDGASVQCDVDGAGRHYCGPVSCIATITELQKEILLNKEVIAVNQQETPQGTPVKSGDLTVWARRMEGDDVAVALYNEDDAAKQIGFEMSAVGMSGSAAVSVRDLWKHADLGSFTGTFPAVTVQAPETVMLRLSPE